MFYIVYGVVNLHTGFDKTGFNKYLVLLISHITVLFSSVLKVIIRIVLYRNQLKLNKNKSYLFIFVLI